MRGHTPPDRLQRRRKRGLFLLAIAWLTSSAAGCAGPYPLQGKVVEGPVAQVLVVSADDPRYTEPDPSAAGAVVWGVLEPNNAIDRERLERVVSDGEGYFVIPIDAPGAGFLRYEIGLTARRGGHRGGHGVVTVPGRGKRVLITLPLGPDTLQDTQDILQDTLRDAQPYLDGDR